MNERTIECRMALIMIIKKAIIVGTVLLIMPLHAARGATVANPRPDVITISGIIDTNTAKDVSSILNDHVKTIAIVSEGGDLDTSIEIGKIIRRNRLSIFISKYCMQNCASIIFLAAEKRFIENNAIVGFEQSATSLFAIARSRGADTVKRKYEEFSIKETDYYHEMGLPEILLYLPFLQLGVQCYRELFGINGSPNDIRLDVKSLAWVPSSQYLRQLGINFSGFWPQTPAEFITAIRADGKFIADPPFIFGSRLGTEDPNLIEKIRADLSLTPRCK